MADLRRYTLAPGILEVTSTAAALPGFPAGLYSLPAEDEARVRISVATGAGLPPVPKDAVRLGTVAGVPGQDAVWDEQRLLGPLRGRVYLAGLRDAPRLWVNRLHPWAFRVRIGGMRPVGQHLLDVAMVRLLVHGMALLHAGAVVGDGAATLLVAAPGAGKTASVLRATQAGYGMMAEEMVVAGAGHAYGLPMTSTLAYGDIPLGSSRRGLRWRLGAFRWLHRVVPPLAAVIPTPAITIQSVVPGASVVLKAPVKRTILLRRGPVRREQMEPEEATRQALLVNRREYTYYEDRLLLGYSTLNPWLDMEELMEREASTLGALLMGGDSFLCQAPSAAEVAEGVLRILDGG